MIANADAARIPLPDKSVHCVVTSPPYFGPRKYKGEQSRNWPAVSYSPMPGLPPLEVPAMRCELGREATPESYIAHLVLCFREVYRVLRDDGTCWVVEGDSYQGSGQGWGSSKSNYPGYKDRYDYERPPGFDRSGKNGLKSGDLMAIPYRLLLALQADGWLVRNDVVWSKVAPMPESVSGTKWERHQVKVKAQWNEDNPHPSKTGGVNYDRGRNGQAEWSNCPGCPRCSATGGYVLRRGSWRHTRSHETVLMLCKGMQYYSDQERVKEIASGERTGGFSMDVHEHRMTAGGIPSDCKGQSWSVRNPRDVVTPAPSPFSGPHYAAFPPDLIRPLILSSAPLKCCPVCGAGWAPVIEQSISDRPDNPNPALPYTADSGHTNGTGATTLHKAIESRVLSYRPACACNAADWQPSLVLDCFAGSGTTGLVCRELGLRFAGLDISREYLRDIALARSEKLTPAASLVTLPMFAELSR